MKTRVMRGAVLVVVLVAAPALAGVNTATVTWTDNSPDETSFRVERAPGNCSAGNVFTEIAVVPANTIPAPSDVSYVDAPLAGGQTFAYRVRAEAGGVFSEYTPALADPSQRCVDIVIQGLPTPGTGPTGLRVQ